ncbi:kinase-like protein [Peniophora sp. CONT]|nr:kinase-like protein [Peniophora sp. CONT]
MAFWRQRTARLLGTSFSGISVLKRHLNTRYHIVKELGKGMEATVFLVHDTAASPVALNTPLAVRALRSDVSADQGTKWHELEVLQTMRGASNIPQLRDHFMHGEHLCLVTDAYASDLLTVQRGPRPHSASSSPRKKLPADLVRHVARSILQALACLHDKDIAHTDIKPDNIFLDTSSEELPDLLSSNIVLGDFGEATPVHGNCTRLIQPAGLRSPEVVAGCKWDTKVDIWNLGCITFELLAGNTLFPAQPEPYKLPNGQECSANQYLFALQHSYTMLEGEEQIFLIVHFMHGSNLKDLYCRGDDGRPCLKVECNPDPATRETLEKILHIYDIFTPELFSFLQAMLRMHPEDRCTAKKLLTHPWLYMSDQDTAADQ